MKKRTHRKAKPDGFDPRVLIGPHFRHMLARHRDHGPRERVQGRWLSAVWASRIRWVVGLPLDSQTARAKQHRSHKLARIQGRFGSAFGDVPF